MVGSGKAREKADPRPGSAERSPTPPGLKCGEDVQTRRVSLGCPVGGVRYVQREGAGDLPPGKRVGVRGTEERGFRASGSIPSEGRALWRSRGRQARGFGLWEVRAAPALDTL